ncbi:fibulin-7-like [Ptychodera flava]|uniref:fibulin-7-like n=1 Tax=Ptychodera flava TaxID=63121 RepID=UPI00396A8334
MQNRTSTSFSNNGVIGFSCNTGYQLIGTDTLYCNNGNWSGPIPQCNDIDECSSTPCKNGGQCVDQENMYMCQCLEGYEGVNCENGMNSYL